MPNQPKKLDGHSLDVTQENIEQLKQALPIAFSEDGRIDFDKLKATLGDNADLGERYGLTWKGKSNCFRAIQKTTTKTLKPMREDSVDFDTSQNVFIEGDNLEALKVLQRAYYGKVKMIYIDPPYNTGNDFVYNDKFAQSQAEYEQEAGIRNESGDIKEVSGLRKNSRDGGHFHSNWLNMMYPRLYLARNLLRQDGVIFISIDDNEVHNLRIIMNEIFGEENFVAQVIWQKKYAVSNDDPGISPAHDYILVYQRSAEFRRNLLPRNQEQIKRYQNIDNDYRGPWASDNYVSNKSRYERPTLWYPILHPKTGEEVWPEESAVWRYSKEKHEQITAENRLYWGPNLSYKRPRLKRFLSEVQDGVVPSTLWPFSEVGHNDEGQKETAKILGPKIFSTPKPVRLMKRILQISTYGKVSDIVLDFFAGSGATAQGVMELNAEDGGNRKWVMIQVDEETDENSEARKAGYKTIADIARERIRRAAKKIAEEGKFAKREQSLDIGFKAFKLNRTNFKIWDSSVKDPDKLEQQMRAMFDTTRSDVKEEDLLFELMLKSGVEPTAELEQHNVDGHYWNISGSLIVCLAKEMTKNLFTEILEKNPRKVMLLDRSLQNNDRLKTNVLLQADKSKVEVLVV